VSGTVSPSGRDAEPAGGWPATLWLGLGVIALAEVFILIDYFARGQVIVGPGSMTLPRPEGSVERVARFVAVNMTPICWAGYLLLFEGLLTKLAWRGGDAGGGCIRKRPWMFAACFLTSVPVWCYWDWINFYFMDAWRYYGLTRSVALRYAGYFIAFAAISPGMFLAAQLFQRLGMSKLNTATGPRAAKNTLYVCVALAVSIVIGLMLHWRHTDMYFGLSLPWAIALLLGPGFAMMIVSRAKLLPASLGFGVGWVVFSFIIANPVGNFVMWASPVFLLDPINRWLGMPSLLADWRDGRWGRTIALMAGGLLCGFCWEFWNYLAIAKWVYHLPMLGPLEQYKYFEMPLIGLMGFLPFGPACWVMWQTLRAAMPGVTEPLPTDDDVL